MAQMKIYFIVPDPDAFPSGGNIYNASLCKALKKHAPFFQQYTYEAWWKELIGRDDESAILFFDSLYLSKTKQAEFHSGRKARFFLIVHHLKSLEQPIEQRKQYFLKYEHNILHRFDGFLTSSAFSLSYLREMGLIAQQGICIEPALEQAFEIRQKLNEKIRAILVANLVVRKGILEFLTEVEEKKGELEGVLITIVGTDEIEPAYAKLCKAKINALSTFVKYDGSKSHSETLALLNQSNLFISCASMETYGMALQEARRFGLPILAVEGGNVKEHLREKENGLLFDTVAKLVKGFCQLNADKNLFDQLLKGAALSDDVENYTWKRAAELLLSFLQNSTHSNLR